MLLAALSVASALEAGVVQGVVLEHMSGRPVSRATVQLIPLPARGAAAGQPLHARTPRSGQFSFTRVPPGDYFLLATRHPYFPAAYGQRVPSGRGRPLTVTADSTLYTELRFRIKGAITGRVLDENGVPAPGVPVVAYRARLPLRVAASGVSDDRGVYRVGGLMPGRYWIRTGAHAIDEGGGWQPTFSPASRELRDAVTHEVELDRDTAYVDVSPDVGNVYTLTGTISCTTPTSINVTLSSETVHRTAQTYCASEPGAFQFPGLPVGNYDVLAQAGPYAGFADVQLARSTTVNMTLVRSPQVRVLSPQPVSIVARRPNPSGEDEVLTITGTSAVMTPGHWLLSITPPAGSYVRDASHVWTPRRARPAYHPESDAFEIFVDQRFPTAIDVRLNSGAGSIGGSVLEDRKGVRGIPVFLWPGTEQARRALSGVRETITDTQGSYRFDGLPPGKYRLLASFDVLEVDDSILERSRAAEVLMEAGRAITQDLAPWSTQ